jgi:hypothetical protein
LMVLIRHSFVVGHQFCIKCGQKAIGVTLHAR